MPSFLWKNGFVGDGGSLVGRLGDMVRKRHSNQKLGW